MDVVLDDTLVAPISEADNNHDSVICNINKIDDHSKDLENAEGTKPVKRIKMEESAGNYTSHRENSLKEILKNIYKAMTMRLNGLDKKVNEALSQCHSLEAKVNSVSKCLGQNDVKLPDVIEENGYSPSSKLTLNSENDFPNGSWLGDENDPEHRVRCRISPDDLPIIDRSCHTAEKLALTLLDYLFDRETQACSNISGHGRHRKKQLDPLTIYGIKCHLIHRFNISESDWHKIRLNLDSKCRTAFRRKLKGMPLAVKSFRGTDMVSAASQEDTSSKAGVNSMANLNSRTSEIPTPAFITPIFSPGEPSSVCVLGGCVRMKEEDDLESQSYHKDDIEETFLTLDAKGTLVDLTENHTFALELGFEMEPNSQVIHTLQGEIQVLHATPEQLAEIQKSGKIQILTSNQVLQEVEGVKLESKWNAIADSLLIEEHLDGETN